MGRFMIRIFASIFSLSTLVYFVPLAAHGQSTSSGLADAANRDLVEQVCSSCHRPNLITRSSGYTRDDWQELVGTMIDLSHDADLRRDIVQYLADHYPPNTARASTLVPGDMEIEFTEWQVPTLGQRSRDPVEAPDGAIWWVGQWGNLMGLLDPVTGDITVYEMPNPAARDPHTAVFDSDGILWFTLQQSNMIGRLDPETGDIRLVTAPTERSRPYGIKVDSEGSLWVACNGSNCLIKVNPETMALTEYKLPIPETTVRRLDIASDGMIWYVNSSQGRLGRLDPKTGEAKEWPSPSGPKSHPYALVVIDDIVWYNESGVRPDPLVRFDPETETFQSWPIPTGNIYAGIVRHMRPTRDGDLLIHQSSTNRIIRVEIPDDALNE